jgi:two-component system, sensor histidine kinase and response regulator
MKHLLCLLLFFFLTHLPLLAQKRTVDELLPQLAHSKEDTNKINLLNKLSIEFAFVNTDSGKYFATQAINLSEKLNYPKGKAEAWLNLGFIEGKSDPKKAMEYSEQALALATQIKDDWITAHAYRQIGQIYGSQGSFSKSSDYSVKALEITKKLGNKKGMAQICINLANNRNKQKKYDEMIMYGEEAVKIGEEIKDEVVISDAYVILGNYYAFVEKNIAKGKEILEKSLKIRQKLGNRRGEISLLRSIGSCYKDEKKYDIANKYYQQALQIAYELKDNQAYCFTLCGIGDLHNLRNQTDSAIYYFEKSLTISEKGNYFTEKQRAYQALYKVYAYQKQHEKAYQYANLYYSLNDSITNIDNAKKIKEMKVDFELEKKEKEIALLNTQNELQIEESKNQKLLIYLFALGLFALAVVASLIFRSKEKEKKAKQLLQQQNEVIAQKNKDLQEKNNHIEAQNEEIIQQNEEISMQSEKLEELNKMKDKLFSVIAHDLRSPIASLKNTLHTSHLEGLSTDDLRQINVSLNHQLANVDNTVETLLQWARVQMAVVKPNPQNFPLFAVADEIVSFLQDTASKKQIEIESEIPENLIAYADINHIRIALRNILANAVKFSYENGKIVVNAKKTEDSEQIITSIKDTGTGMTPAQLSLLFTINMSSQRGTAGEKGTGLGLILCKEFIERNGGQIWVESEEGKGSVFFFSVKKGI